MPNLPRLSQAPFISPTNNMLLIPCFMDEVHAVSYLVLSITSNCLQLPASVFKVIFLFSLCGLMKRGCVARGGHPPPALATAALEELEIREERHTCSWDFQTFLFWATRFFAVGKVRSWGDARAPPWEVSRLLDWDFPQWYAGRTWDASSPAAPRSGSQPGDAPLCSWARGGVGLDVRDVAGAGSAGGDGSSRGYVRQLPRLLGGVVTPPHRSCVTPPNWTLCSVPF